MFSFADVEQYGFGFPSHSEYVEEERLTGVAAQRDGTSAEVPDQ